jgi:hypothetical protein
MNFLTRPYQSNIEEILSVLYLIAALLAHSQGMKIFSAFLYVLSASNAVTSILITFITRRTPGKG